jgi:hypothetical protein
MGVIGLQGHIIPVHAAIELACCPLPSGYAIARLLRIRLRVRDVNNLICEDIGSCLACAGVQFGQRY